MFSRTFAMIATTVSLAVPAVAFAQIGTDSLRAERAVADEPTSVVIPAAAGPRLPTRYAHDTQVLMPRSAAARLAPAPDEGGNHTIVISTLALVLGIILIVVLVAR